LLVIRNAYSELDEGHGFYFQDLLHLDLKYLPLKKWIELLEMLIILKIQTISLCTHFIPLKSAVLKFSIVLYMSFVLQVIFCSIQMFTDHEDRYLRIYGYIHWEKT